MPLETAEVEVKETKEGRETSIKHGKDFNHFLTVGKNSEISTDRKDSDSWILVTYDVSGDNSKRNWIREKIIRMGGLWKNDSTYLVPKSVRSVDEIRQFGKHTNVNLFVVGMHVDDREDVKTLTQAYIGKLLDDIKEIRDSAKKSFNVLQLIEENIELSEEELKDKHNVSFRGFHNVVKSVKDRSHEIEEMCQNYGNNDDEFEIQLLYSFVNKLEERFQRIKEAKGLNK